MYCSKFFCFFVMADGEPENFCAYSLLCVLIEVSSPWIPCCNVYHSDRSSNTVLPNFIIHSHFINRFTSKKNGLVKINCDTPLVQLLNCLEDRWILWWRGYVTSKTFLKRITGPYDDSSWEIALSRCSLWEVHMALCLSTCSNTIVHVTKLTLYCPKYFLIQFLSISEWVGCVR